MSTVANGGPAPAYQGSDSNSSASSLSSSTPVSSLSGLSQILYPPVFGHDMVDVAISTDDRSRSSAEATAESAMQTEPNYASASDHPPPNGSYPSAGLVASDTSRTVGARELLKDTVIRGNGQGVAQTGGAGDAGRGRARSQSSGEQEAGKQQSPKTAALMALSKPRRPIRRSQSQVTVSGEPCEIKAGVISYNTRRKMCS